jgi:DNA-binding GntR family transcriptional regulator
MAEAQRKPVRRDAPPVLVPAATRALAETVAERLRDTIFSGQLAPGDRLREEQLAGALDVSRGPIRDALLQLEREGLIVRRRNRGAVVASLSRADLDEVFSLRLAIEPVVCTWAARNSGEGDWAEMQARIDAFAQLDTTTTLHDAAEIDLHFHDVVYCASGHMRLLRLWHDLRPQVYIFMLARTYVQDPDFGEIMIRSHARLLDAIRARDEELVRRVAAEHVETSYRRVIAGHEGVELGSAPAVG